MVELVCFTILGLRLFGISVLESLQASSQLLFGEGMTYLTDSLASQDDGENFVTEMMSWEQRIWTENVLFGPWGPLS